jgi:tetratricopeptide (TPR) repeat protein
MKTTLRKIHARLTAAIWLMTALCLFFPASDSHAVQSIYTIQAGSFESDTDADKQYDLIAGRLKKEDLQYLRIERIGKFYAVRIGKFNDRPEAEKFLLSNNPGLPGAIIMSAYYMEERIEKLYEIPSSEEEQPPAIKPLTTEVHETEKPGTMEEDALKYDKEISAATVDQQIDKISAMVDTRDYQAALELTESGMKSWPEEPKLIGWYGAVLIKMNLPDKAIIYFRKAAALSPEVPDYHSGIGYCLFFLGKFNEAINEFDKTLVLDPEHVDALAGLGVAYIKTGKKDKAMAAYNRLTEIDRKVADRILKVIEGEKL